jgi:hypothetical protein
MTMQGSDPGSGVTVGGSLMVGVPAREGDAHAASRKRSVRDREILRIG